MSTLARVFTVLVLICSLVYLGITATLYAYRQNYRQMRDEDTKTKNPAELAKKDDEIKTRDAEIKLKEEQNRVYDEASKAAVAKAKEAEDKLNAAKAAADKKDGELTALRGQYETISNKIGDKDKEIEQLTTQLEEASKGRDEAVAAREQAEQALLDTQTRLTNVEKNVVDLEKTYIQKVKELEMIKGQISLVPPEKMPTDQRQVKAIDGKVLAVSKVTNLLIINVGKDRGVEVDDQFTVYRGDKFVGKAQVLKADKDWSSAKMIEEYKRLDPSVGDDISSKMQ